MQAIKVKSHIDEFEKRFKKAEKKATTKAVIHIQNAAKDMLSKPGQGERYGDHRASAPGDPPASDTGNLRRTISRKVDRNLWGFVGYVGTPEKYGAGLERGTSEVEPRPWLKPTMKEERKEVKEIYKAELKKL